MLWKCSVCSYMHEGSEAPEKCPKCGSPREKYAALSEEEAKKILSSDRTNDIHMEIIRLAMEIKNLAKAGMDINLDPPCMAVFKQAHDEAWIIKQRSKAELGVHIGKGKW